MGINLGTGAISKLYLGATEIQKAYLGGSLVYDAAPAGGLLLDNYPNAAAAYSLRQLRTGVTNVVRVRESGGNTEQDFTASQITDGTLAAFCGANNGFVTVWYDQSGNGRDASQAITTAQPQIVNAGALFTLNSKPYISFTNNSELTYTTAITPITTFVALKVNTTNIVNYVLWNGLLSGLARGYLPNGTITGLDGFGIFDGALKSIGGESLNLRLGYYFYNGSAFEVAQNGASIAALAAGSSIPVASIGRAPDNLSLDGLLGDCIMYTSDQSANKTAIETEINAHYGIY